MAEAYFPALESTRPSWSPTPKTLRPGLAYLKGISFALPLLFSCLAILVLKFSLWGGEAPADVATAIALGTVCSFVVSGGFIQAMARRGLWYAGTGQFGVCAESSWSWVRLGALASALFAVVAMALNVYFDWIPQSLGLVAAAFHLSLSLFWLSTGMLYMLGRNLTVGATALAGIAGVFVLHRGLGLPLLAAQIVAILSATALAFRIAAHLLRRQAKGDPGHRARSPLGKRFYFAWPYFVYGSLYYVFLFADRLLTWTARTEGAAWPIQFRAGYESAQDLALFAFILQVGWVHAATVDFYHRLTAAQKNFTIAQLPEFNQELTDFYHRKLLSFVPLALMPSAIVYLVGRSYGFFDGLVNPKVALWSLAGFPFLVLSLWNVSLLFGLSRPLYVVWAIASACAADVGIGYLLSRMGSYEQAVAGFTVGAVCFAAVSSYCARKTLRRLDYYYFASAA